MGDAFLNRELEGSGLSSGPAYLVLELAAEGTLNLTELSRRVGVDPAHTTRIAHRLEDDGYARRAPDPEDGRSSLLTLTAKGRRAAVKIEKAMLAWVAIITEGVDPADIEATNRAFSRFYSNALARRGGFPDTDGSSEN
jgi:DNA-binding MarR family transcriptional regulator